MSYQTGSATDTDDLMSKLNTFLTGTPGWTADLFDSVNNRAVYHKAGISRYFQFQWNVAEIGLAMVASYSSNNPWTSQPECEFPNAVTTNGRYVNNMTGPYPSYHFFEDDNYIHIVVEISSGLYRHFGCGQMLKLGNWTGGAYAMGFYWSQTTADIDNPTGAIDHSAVFSGYRPNNSTRPSGIHAEGLPHSTYVGIRYYRESSATSAVDNDGNNVGNVQSAGWRGGMYTQFMATRQSALNGFRPLQPIAMFQIDTLATPDTLRLLGYIPDMRNINVFGLQPGQEITVGSDTWVVFPVTRKGNFGLSFNQEQSYNLGLAYKKVTT